MIAETPRNKVNILLVDDQPGKLLSYEAILGDLDENLIKAQSAREAFEILLRTDVAVVLVDVCMPDLDGFELASMIRQHPRFQRTAIILVSAVLVDEIDRLRGYSSGAMDYLPVPVVPEILKAKVGVFIDLFRKTRELEALNRELETRVAERTEQLQSSTAELRASREALKEADHRKDEFLAMLAHELRNPLAPIRNAAKLLQLAVPANPETNWSLEVIDRQVDHLTRLIDDLLDISRINRGKLELRRRPVLLADVVKAALENTNALVQRQAHHLRVTLPETPVHLDADPVRLAQVLVNLLHNAAKFTPEGGEIRLEAELPSPHEVLIRVADSGVGIAEDDLSRIFDMFVQIGPDGSSGSHRADSGQGIGLALVRNLVLLHGGTVEAKSEGRGRGSEFLIHLPRALADTARPQTREDDAAQPPRSGRKVLVVDDIPDNALSLALLLRRVGHQVNTAGSGLAALDAIAADRPEIVFLDLGLPDLDGFEVCRRIRAQESGRRMVIVALTGWGQEGDRQRGAAAGFDAHLVKPVEFTELRAILDGSLEAAGETGAN
jgi:signal transduction histidine kinase/ActR/RegA family two-component response regulator